MSQTVWISRVDFVRLQHLIAVERRAARSPILARRRWLSDEDTACLDALEKKLASARLGGPVSLPKDVITLNARGRLRDSAANTVRDFTLVLPERADGRVGLISVLSPLGVALIGSRTGEEIEFRTDEGETRVAVESVLYQPEAAGDLHLW
ncbi:MAG TPA: GreA/GreB family elongation factor [Burkholderiales bacterium]